MEEWLENFARFHFELAGHLHAETLVQESIYVLDHCRYLPLDEERNFRVLKQSLRHRKLETIASFQYYDQSVF